MLGGVDVDNDIAFTAKHNGQYYVAGRIHLNANQALEFDIFFAFHNLSYETYKKWKISSRISCFPPPFIAIIN